MAHHLARLLYRMLKFGKEYVDKGIEYYEAKYRQSRLKWLKKEAAKFGLQLAPSEGVPVRFLESEARAADEIVPRPIFACRWAAGMASAICRLRCQV